MRYKHQGYTASSFHKENPAELALNPKEPLNQFLADVERRAFKMAKFASRNTDEAFDLVQDAMFAFVRRYANRPKEEWNALFYRVLQSRITDWHRRTSVRKRFLSWLGRADDEEDQEDPLQAVADPAGPNPCESALRHEEAVALEKAIRKLPLRQQQAFLLRAWEGLDVAQTALAMGCSEGSIKTHYSRAVHTLRGLLKEVCP
jgi:RNA polymerase sigma-70 factor (ECF subfamily)